jgi:hypothetical protein
MGVSVLGADLYRLYSVLRRPVEPLPPTSGWFARSLGWCGWMAPDLRGELGYGVARVSIFHAVERYGGPEGKGAPRQDFITRRDRPCGDGWEYWLFLPAIRVEEAILGSIRNR